MKFPPESNIRQNKKKRPSNEFLSCFTRWRRAYIYIYIQNITAYTTVLYTHVLSMCDYFQIGSVSHVDNHDMIRWKLTPKRWLVATLAYYRTDRLTAEFYDKELKRN